jgi:peptide/nickel transport system substrate-binding protein
MSVKVATGGRRKAIGAVLAVVAAVTVTDVAGAARTETSPPAGGGTFVDILGADPGNLDPHLSIFVTTANTNAFAYDTLLYPTADGELVSGLAESWEETPTSVTYTLKEGVTCSDGTPLTASTVADNFSFVVDPNNQSPLLGTFVPPGITAEADDAARTVTLTSEQPVPFFLRSTGLNLFIVCANGLADRSLLESGTDGTGPFVLEEAVANDHYTFRARDGYAWGPDGATSDAPGFPSAVELRVVTNESTAANLLLSGEANAAVVSGPDRQRLESEGLFVVEGKAIVGEFFFNQMAELPTADAAVRRALMQAIDLPEMMAAMTGGTGLLPESFVEVLPKACPGNTLGDVLSAGADVDAAGRLLDEAGWVIGSSGVRERDGEPLTLRAIYVTTITGADLVMELALPQWEELGVDVELQGVDDAQFNAIAFESRAWDVILASVNLNLPSQLVPFVSGAQPPDGVNFSAIANPEYEQLAAEASALTGPEACEQWNAAEEALVAEMNILPFAASTLPAFGQGAEFETGGFGIIPATIRLVET